MANLTEHQRESLDAYKTLIAAKPALFGGRDLRPIVRGQEQLAAYAAEHNVVLGVAADTPYVLFIVDLVESRLLDGTMVQHPYLLALNLRAVSMWSCSPPLKNYRSEKKARSCWSIRSGMRLAPARPSCRAVLGSAACPAKQMHCGNWKTKLATWANTHTYWGARTRIAA